MAPDPVAAKQAQRLWPRWFIAGTKPVKVDLGPAGAGPLVDISGGGLRVQSLAPLRRGAEVPVRIDIPDHPEALQCSGIVVWSKPNGAAGIRFTTLTDAQKSMLHGWIAELEKAATNPAATQVQDDFTAVVSQIRGAQLNNADALNMIVRRVKELSPVSGAAIALGNPENMTCMASVGEAPAVGSSIPAVIGITGECVFKRKMVRCDDSKNDPRVGRDCTFGSAVILPLIVNGEVRGVLEAFSKRSYAFDTVSVDAMEKFADAIIFVTHGIVTQRRLATAKASMPSNGSSNLGPKTSATLSPLAASYTAPPSTPAAPQLSDVPASTMARSSSTPVAPSMSIHAVARSAQMEAIPQVGSLEVAPMADPVRYEERVHRVSAPKLPPQRRREPQPQSAPAGKWMVMAAIVAVVCAAPAWYFLKHRPALPVATAAPVTIESPAVTNVSETVTAPAPVVAPASITVNTVPAAKPVAPPPTVVKHEEHVAVVETKPVPPRPEPIMLAANTPKEPRPVDLDTVVPVKLPPASMEPAPVSAMVLPTGTKAAPKFVAPPPEVRIEGTLIKRVNPVYPPMMKSARIQGVVELKLHITPEGVVDKVTRLSGQPMLANAAVDAVKQWRYDPARINGKPVEMETVIRLNFALAQ